MLTFPDPEKPKAFYLARVRKHRAADELIRGTGWDGRRGCAIGCTLETYDHSLYPSLLGVPVVLAKLMDFHFESLLDDWLSFPERFLAAIPEGADLSGVYAAWCVRLLNRRLDQIGDGDEPWRVQCRDAIAAIRDLMTASAASAAWAAARADSAADRATWAAARAASAAWAADRATWAAARADSAAWAADRAASAAWAADRTASAAASADSAAASAASAARAGSAAWAADRADSATNSAARAAEIQLQASDLVELLAAAPIPGKANG